TGRIIKHLNVVDRSRIPKALLLYKAKKPQ
ncbi:hypothetical protein MGSAQ_003246, partial [marine sediment metagenome]